VDAPFHLFLSSKDFNFSLEVTRQYAAEMDSPTSPPTPHFFKPAVLLYRSPVNVPAANVFSSSSLPKIHNTVIFFSSVVYTGALTAAYWLIVYVRIAPNGPPV